MVKSLGFLSGIATDYFIDLGVRRNVRWALKLNIIFKIAGVGIVVAFLHTILDQVGKKEYAQWVTLFGFIYILFMVASIVDDLISKNKIRLFISRVEGGFAD